MKIMPEKIVEISSVITTKIKDAVVAVVSAIRSIEVDHFREALGVYHDGFTWFLASISALKFTTETGKVYFAANKSVLMAMFLIRFIWFLTKLLATLFQMHQRNIAPLLLMLVLESGETILAASLFSGPALWISGIVWLSIYVLLVYCYYDIIQGWF